MLRIKFFAVFILITLPVFGQGFFISETYSEDVYQIDNEFFSIDYGWEFIQDTNQVLYIGTSDGILSFDGRQWDQKHIGEYGRGKSFYMSEDGTLYVSGSTDFGILEPDSLNQKKIQSLSNLYTSKPNRINQHHYTTKLDERVIFFGSQGYDVLKGDSINHFKINNAFIGFGASAKFKNAIYSGVKDGIIFFDGSNVKKVEDSGLFKGDSITVIQNIGDKLLIGSTINGLTEFDGESFKPIQGSLSNFLDKKFVYAESTYNDSLQLFGTLFGGFTKSTFYDDGFQIYDESNGLHSNQIVSTYLDHENTLWLGTNRGIQKLLINQPINVYKDAQGVSSPIFELKVSESHVLISDGISWYSIEKNSGANFEKVSLFDNRFQSFQNESELYFYSSNQIYEFTDIGEFSLIFEHENILSMASINSELAVLTSDGLKSLDGLDYEFNLNSMEGTRNTIFYKNKFFYINRNQFFTTDSDTTIVIPIKDAGSTPIRFNHFGLINDELYLAIQGSDTDNGLYKLNTDSLMFMKATEFGALDNDIVTTQVVTFQQCANGDVWLVNNKLIKRLKWIENRFEVIESPYRLIGDFKAIYSIGCDNDGSVWFGGIEGIYHLRDPDWNYKTDFKTNITRLFVNTDSLIYGGFGELNREIILPYAENELRFNFAATSYIDPTRNTYSYRLDGFDSDWSEWSLESQKDYTNIPEGEYLFQVKSRNVYGVEGSTDSFAFTILPPWYRTWWAYLLYLISISTVMYFAYRIRVHQLLKVERMRTKIASDLHDEVSATLTGISYFAEAVKTDIDVHKKDHFMNLITESAGDAKEKITDIVWSITPENDDWVIFLTKCRRYATDLVESRGMKHDFRFAEHIPGKLTMNTRQHLWMIFKEMITNSVRHSNASRIDLIMDIEEGVFKMIIQDNGEGFDISSKVFGNGLKNIRKRANLIQAKLELDSEPGVGTRWRLELTL